MNAPVAPRPPVNKWLVAISVTFGTLMGTIDASIVNVATPHLRGAMGATVQEITWVTTGFVIANVVVMPLTAFFGRFFGQKRVYMAACPRWSRFVSCKGSVPVRSSRPSKPSCARRSRPRSRAWRWRSTVWPS